MPASVNQHRLDYFYIRARETDGLTVSWSDRWFNLRASNTEPVLRLNVEGPDPAVVEQLVAEVKTVIEGPSDSGLVAPELRAILVCPSCHGDLRDDLENSKLECTGCGLRYPVENGIPVMLIDEAEHPQ